ncbi:TPA: orotidine 5'-phosphate decarboxylase [Candidatus Bathyarchaeota archaeon]|nr:orotidine 5'-phosphate decarboxylase [Candidatus Bathyarchaeota archaeon]
MPSFKEKIEKISIDRDTDIVLALDFPFSETGKSNLVAKAEAVLEAAQPYICAVKINHHLVLPLGVFGCVQKLIKKLNSKGLLTIMDCKINDIGATNQTMAEYYYAAGFDALIANPFVGWEEGLQPVFEVARRYDRGVILLSYMSHKGAIEGYGQTIVDSETGTKIPQYISFARKALKWQADGVVIGATVPEKIREINEVLQGKVPIYSPGVGAQGGHGEKARKAGARYLIVGREITMADDPGATAKRISSA